ncbi:rho GTPase-activating protein 15-like isoform X2 [Ctenocephalides felis]|uniref:rho GTPase-activating protein 15-like isoform X2 n=1 Tax=Ctenocephalides felis TaxID=7515 RepID=UPI000E6E3293|nr:rho GTPase-activating protein 15-like isoform X2 [Ctenocephalides felis]
MRKKPLRAQTATFYRKSWSMDDIYKTPEGTNEINKLLLQELKLKLTRNKDQWMVIDPELVEEQKGKSTSQELVVPKLVSFKPISAASQAAFRNELQGRLVEMHQPSTSTANDDVVCLRSDENTPADLTPPQRRVISRSTESIFEGAGPQLRTSVKNDRRKLKSVLVIPPHSGLSSKGPISLDVEKSDTKLPATNTTDDDVISNKKGKSENLDREQAKFNLLKWFRKRPPMDTLIKKGIIQGTIFGASLESLCVGLGALTPHVPPFVRACTERLENTEGFMESDGLYRASANLSTIQRLRIQVNQGILDAIREEEDPHVIAGSLKLFFRELKEPLIPFNAFHSFLEANAIPDDNERVLRLRDLVHCLPICNRDTLQHLVAHLIRVTECSQANRMHVNNLSIVWGPSLMWIPPASVADDQPNNAPRSPSAVCFDLAIHCFEQNRVIDTLITNHEQIFL